MQRGCWGSCISRSASCCLLTMRKAPFYVCQQRRRGYTRAGCSASCVISKTASSALAPGPRCGWCSAMMYGAEQQNKLPVYISLCQGGKKNGILTSELTECVNMECICIQVGVWPQHTVSWKYLSDHKRPKITGVLVMSSYFASIHTF